VTIQTADGSSRAVKTQRARTAVSGVFHFNEIYGETDYELAYAFCYIQSDKDQQVTAYFGSNDQAKVWVNGRLVHEAKVGRSCTARQDTFRFGLKKGLNPILVKVCENWGDWAFVIEVFTDEYLALERRRPLARALGDIERLDLCLGGVDGETFAAEREDFPKVVWQNPYEVEKLLGKFPLTVRWFDSQGEAADRPAGAGHYVAVAEGRSPDGFLIRRAKRFTCGKPAAAEPGGGNSEARAESVTSLVEMVNGGTADAVSLSYVGAVTETAGPVGLPTGTYAGLMDRSIRKGQTCVYWLDLPVGYGQAAKKWPLILSLHASRGQGRDLTKMTKRLPPADEAIRRDFPFVVVSPQCPDEYDAWPSDLLADLIDDIVQKYDVDARRVYITGFSLGGRGCWSFACDYPERVAAVVPVAGTYDHPERIRRIKNVPVWAFHGDRDGVVTFADTKKMVEDLKAAGGNVRFTVYEGAGHGISGRVYRTKELYDWLLRQRNH
jgi:predicted esterase